MTIEYNNLKSVSARDIKIPNGIIKAGDLFLLRDVCVVDSVLWVGIDTGKEIQEAGFAIPEGFDFKTKRQLSDYVGGFIAPYIKNCSKYTFIRCD